MTSKDEQEQEQIIDYAGRVMALLQLSMMAEKAGMGQMITVFAVQAGAANIDPEVFGRICESARRASIEFERLYQQEHGDE